MTYFHNKRTLKQFAWHSFFGALVMLYGMLVLLIDPDNKLSNYVSYGLAALFFLGVSIFSYKGFKVMQFPDEYWEMKLTNTHLYYKTPSIFKDKAFEIPVEKIDYLETYVSDSNSEFPNHYFLILKDGIRLEMPAFNDTGINTDKLWHALEKLGFKAYTIYDT